MSTPRTRPSSFRSTRSGGRLIEPLESRVLLSAGAVDTTGANLASPPPGVNMPVGQGTILPTPVPPIPISVDTGTVTGTVTDASGNPVADARVWLNRPVLDPLPPVVNADGSRAAPAISPIFYPPPFVATTDASGKFDLSDVPVGAYSGSVHKLGFQDGSFSTTVAKDQTSDVSVTLTAVPTGTVQGSVKDATGAAVANADVRLIHQPIIDPLPLAGAKATATASGGAALPGIPGGFDDDSLHTTTDANGNYSLPGVPEGTYTAIASSQGAGYGKADVTVTKDQTSTADTTLQQPQPPVQDVGTVTGTVKDSDGKPVEGATVALLPAPIPYGGPPTQPDGSQVKSAADIAIHEPLGKFTATTDASGNFTLSNVPVGSYTALAHASDGSSGKAPVDVTKDQTTDVTVTLEKVVPPVQGVGSLDGTVKDASGNPIVGATVGLIPKIPPPYLDPITGGGTTSKSPAGGVGLTAIFLHTTTDANGAFSLANIPARDYMLVVEQPGFAPDREAASITADQTTTVNVTLQQAQPPVAVGTGTVKGTVNDSGGAAVGSALVVLVPDFAGWAQGLGGGAAPRIAPPPNVLHTITDASGAFELDNVPAGDYTAVIVKPGKGFDLEMVTVTQDQTSTVTATLNPIAKPGTGTGGSTTTASAAAAILPAKTVKTLITSAKKSKAAAARAAKLAARAAKIAQAKAAHAAKVAQQKAAKAAKAAALANHA